MKGPEEVLHEVPLVSHKGSLLGKFFSGGHSRPKSALPATSTSKVGIDPSPSPSAGSDLLQSTSAQQLQQQQQQKDKEREGKEGRVTQQIVVGQQTQIAV